jgi:hypothetical protein
VVAILAREHSAAVFSDLQYPDLEGFGAYARVVLMRDYGVQEPIGAASFGNIVCAVRVGDRRPEWMAIPMSLPVKLRRSLARRGFDDMMFVSLEV